MIVDHRACNRCREILPNADFYGRNDGYLNYICKGCYQKKERRYREKMSQYLWWRVKQSEHSKAYVKRKKNESAQICPTN